MKSSTSKNEKSVVVVPLSPGENVAAGAFGGAVETCLQMPLITYKLCSQEGRKLPTSFSGWYRGVGVQAGTVAPITALQFCVNGGLQQLVHKWHVRDGTKKEHLPYSLSDTEKMMTAGGAGAISAIVYGPVDVLTIQQQKLEMSLPNAIRHLVHEYGIAGLYRGFVATTLREGIYTAGYLGLAPVLTRHLMMSQNNNERPPFWASVVGASFAGTISALMTHPIDTAKTCIQSDMTGRTWSPSITASIRKLYENGGIMNLYRGVIPRTTRICGAFFICMMVQDLALEYKAKQQMTMKSNLLNGNESSDLKAT